MARRLTSRSHPHKRGLWRPRSLPNVAPLTNSTLPRPFTRLLRNSLSHPSAPHPSPLLQSHRFFNFIWLWAGLPQQSTPPTDNALANQAAHLGSARATEPPHLGAWLVHAKHHHQRQRVKHVAPSTQTSRRPPPARLFLALNHDHCVSFLHSHRNNFEHKTPCRTTPCALATPTRPSHPT